MFLYCTTSISVLVYVLVSALRKSAPSSKRKDTSPVWQISKNQKEKRLRRVKFSTVGVKRRLDF